MCETDALSAVHIVLPQTFIHIMQCYSGSLLCIHFIPPSDHDFHFRISPPRLQEKELTALQLEEEKEKIFDSAQRLKREMEVREASKQIDCQPKSRTNYADTICIPFMYTVYHPAWI